MKKRLLELLACPRCASTLEIGKIDREDEHGCLEEGELECSGCKRPYPVRLGIPRFVTTANMGAAQKKVKEHFEQEFTEFADEDSDLDDPKVVEFYFYSRTGIDPNLFEGTPGNLFRTEIGAGSYRPSGRFIEGKVVLDAGCGPGRFTLVAAEAGTDYVVGLDLGDHVERAAERCRSMPNVDFVQASILEPPFARETFDFAFSLGVLHHTPDPERGCIEVGKRVKKGGAMSLMVYSPAYWGGRVRGVISRALYKLLSRLDPSTVMTICRRVLYPIGRLQLRLSEPRWLKYLFAPLFLINIPRHPKREVMIATIFDYYGPRIVTTHTFQEVNGWLAKAGFHEVRELPVPTSCFAVRAAVGPER